MNDLIKTTLEKAVQTQDGLDTVPVRIIVGGVLAAHGAQKLFSWFGGYGLEGTGAWMASIGLEPGYLMALLAGSAEFFGGLALVIGLFVRPAALLVAFTMLIAMVTVHLKNGLFMSNNGYEYTLVLLVVSIGLVIRGAGSFSVDKALQNKI